MSVSCRKIHDEDDPDQSEIRKQSTAELPQDRVTYYKRLQGQVKIGSQDLSFNHRQVWVTAGFIYYKRSLLSVTNMDHKIPVKNDIMNNETP